MNDIGFSTKEGVSNGLAPFSEPAKRNIGMFFERERGVENKPFRINNPAEDLVRFGGYSANMYGPTVVRHLFRNAKGFPVTMYGVRIIGSSSVAATTGSVTLQGQTHEYTAAQEGVADKGTWANNNVVIKFYSYDYKTKNTYYAEVYYKGELKETFTGSTMAGLQSSINSTSMYASVSYGGEYTLPTLTAGTGTITATLGSKTITGTSTTFSASTTPVGTLLTNNAGATIGRIAAIASTTSITLEQNAQVAVAGAAFKQYVCFSQTFTLASGTYVAPVEADFYGVASTTAPKGLNILDGVDVQIIYVAENNSLTMATELNNYVVSDANTERGAIGVVNLPLNASEAVIQTYSALQTTNSSFLACYNVWVLTSDGQTNPSNITVPGMGCVLGAAFIRATALQDDYIHIPPAGYDSAFIDIIECYPKQISQATLNLYTRNYTINSVVYIQRVGWFVMTSRTMSTNSLYHSIHIRMQTSFYIRVLKENMGWVIQKPNTPELKTNIYNSLYAYFKGQYDVGALERSITIDEALKIICDLSNNPLSQDRKSLNVDIDWIPTETTEAFRISLNRNDGLLIVKAAEQSAA